MSRRRIRVGIGAWMDELNGPGVSVLIWFGITLDVYVYLQRLLLMGYYEL